MTWRSKLALTAAVAVLPLGVAASPAPAGPAQCHVLAGQAGPVSDVTLCAGADVVLGSPPAIEREQCGGFGSCMMFFVDYEVRGQAAATLSLCYTFEGQRVCSTASVPTPVVEPVPPGRACTGYDLRGGFPCGAPITFE